MGRPRVINLNDAHKRFDAAWSPKRIARVDDYEVKLAKGEGSFAWHAHADEDELFYVTSGRLRIELEGDEPVVLGPGDLTVIPKGVRHRPVVEAGPVHILLFERAGVVNTGDAEAGDLTQIIEDL
jgi:mannose-6-phosphate isomerase-like protein (cupin superfamily)